ncbi:ABC transporter ATP-binding protein [Algoriphagus namhaensis]
MFSLQAEEISKRFQYEWIYRKLSIHLNLGESLAITGGNGSGKSTLIKNLSGAVPLTSGKLTFSQDGKALREDDWYQYLSIAAPYLEVPEEFTLQELLSFHFKFKKPYRGASSEDILKITYLQEHKDKQISQFSSGMKQRVKIGLAVFSDVPLVFLDEPTSNLDKKGIRWYQELVEEYLGDRIVIVATNEEREYAFCKQIISMEDYK